MADPPGADPDPTDGEDGAAARSQISPVPFLIALVGFVVVAALAFAFLRADDEGMLVRADRLDVVGPDVVRALAIEHPGCGVVDRAQVDLAAEAVFVELVVVDAEGPCSDVPVDIVAEITLPEPVGDRPVLAGVGRLHLPCAPVEATWSSVACSAAR